MDEKESSLPRGEEEYPDYQQKSCIPHQNILFDRVNMRNINDPKNDKNDKMILKF